MRKSITCLLLLITTGCTDHVAVDQGLQLASLEAKVRHLEQSLDTLGRTTAASLNSIAKKPSPVYIQPDDTRFSICPTAYGNVLLSTEHVANYLDGFKIKIRAGNLTAATLEDIKIHATWPAATNANPGLTLFEEKDFEPLVSLQPGAWNNIELTITPLTAQQLRQMEINLTANSVGLKPARN